MESVSWFLSQEVNFCEASSECAAVIPAVLQAFFPFLTVKGQSVKHEEILVYVFV